MSDAVFEEGDDSLAFDMENVDAAVNEIVPKGTYICAIDDMEFKMSQASNKPMWSVTMTIVEEGDFKGRKLFTNMSFSEKALPITKGTLMAIAPEIISSTFDPKALAEEQCLVGKTVKVKTKIGKYEGNDKTEVASISKAPEGDLFED